MLQKLKKLFSRKPPITVEYSSTPKEQPATFIRKWRQGMWVVYKSRIGILFKLDEICEVHLVNVKTGETIEQVMVPLSGLRQAKWAEIPECRRNITHEKGAALGYGS